MDQTIVLTQKCGCGPLTDASSFDGFRKIQEFVDALKAALRVQSAKTVGATLKLEFTDGPR
jgi:hypothetical protein